MSHTRFAATAAASLLAILIASPVSTAQAQSAEVVAVRRATLPSAPDDAAWRDVPVFTAALITQDMVEPRLLEASADKVGVRAMTDGSRIAFRLEWVDPTTDDLPGIARYADGCAVQLPVTVGPDVPAPMMGESQRPVEITYWRAFWQSAVAGREDSINALYPGAAVDHYPFEAATEPGVREEMGKRYAPARALGNEMAGPRDRPVQDLIAEGPGTIRPAARATSDGRGMRTDAGWAVALSRPLPAGLGPGKRTQVAFAVWQGSKEESGARKMRSIWIPLLVEGAR